MSLKEWAKREIEIACKRENPNRKDVEFDYGCACYESALKAFESLCEDGHSGFSIGMTKHILNRLIDGKPLTPIEDTNDIWKECSFRRDGCKTYQCKRMYSFFKDVYSDGRVEYHDNDRYVAVNIDNPNVCWHSGLVSRVVHELFPITMPYMPTEKPYKVYCKELLTDPENGDFDTVGIFYIVTPEGEKVEVQRYFREGSAENQPWTEIDVYEWVERTRIHIERLEQRMEVDLDE